MAKILVEYDTVEKVITVKKDGQEIKNIRSVSFYPNYENDKEMCCSVTTLSENEDDGIREMYNLMADKAISDIAACFRG